MGLKIFVVMDSTDSWSGETSLYRAFRTEKPPAGSFRKLRGFLLTCMTKDGIN